jgi:hypothetical protein
MGTNFIYKSNKGNAPDRYAPGDFFVLYARGCLDEMPTGSAFGNFFILVHFFLDKKIRLFYLIV